MIQEWQLPTFPLNMKIIELYHKPLPPLPRSQTYIASAHLYAPAKNHTYVHIPSFNKKTVFVLSDLFECWVGGLFNHKYVSEWAASRSGNVAPTPQPTSSSPKNVMESLCWCGRTGAAYSCQAFWLLFCFRTEQNLMYLVSVDKSADIFWGKWSLIGCQCCSRQKLVKSPESPTFLFRHCQLKGQNSKSMLPHHFTCQF